MANILKEHIQVMLKQLLIDQELVKFESELSKDETEELPVREKLTSSEKFSTYTLDLTKRKFQF